jgi:2-C-methyl-D-erythritol 2,4-cyclodiphosphate synthase
LRRVAELIKNEGYAVSNIDCTIVAQKPKLAPHIQNMKQNIAEDLSIDEGRVNVKATTEEGLGFTGEMKGISAHAVALIVK